MKNQPLRLWMLSTRDHTPFETIGIGEELSVEPLEFERYPEMLESIGSNEQEQPDLIEIGSTWTAYTALRQEHLRLLDLTDMARETHATNVFFPSSRQTCLVENKGKQRRYWALPFTVDVRLLFYRPMFGQMSSESEDPFTRLGAFVDEVKRRQIILKQPIIAFPTHFIFQDILPWIWSCGGEIVTSDRRCLLNHDTTRHAILEYVKLVAGDCSPVLADAPKTLHELALGFWQMDYLIASAGLWLLGMEPQTEVHASALPPETHRAAFVGGTNLAIVQKKSDTDETLQRKRELLKTLTLDSFHQQKYAALVGVLPANMRAWRDMKANRFPEWQTIMQTKPLSDRILDAVEDALITERQLPSLPEIPQIEEEINECFKRMFGELEELESIDDVVLEAVVEKHLVETQRSIVRVLSGGIEFFSTRDDIPANQTYDLVVDRPAKMIKVRTNSDTVRKKEIKGNGFKILDYLLEHYPEPCSAADIYAHVWSESIPNMNDTLRYLRALGMLHGFSDEELKQYLKGNRATDWILYFKDQLTSIDNGDTSVDSKFRQARDRTFDDLLQIIEGYITGALLDQDMYHRLSEAICRLRRALGGRDVLPWEQDGNYQLNSDLVIAVVLDH